MSYCRFVTEVTQSLFEEVIDEIKKTGETTVLEVPELSDVYVFENILKYLECCGCRLKDSVSSYTTRSRQQMIDHLNEHQAAGYLVPNVVFDELHKEIEDFGDSLVKD